MKKRITLILLIIIFISILSICLSACGEEIKYKVKFIVDGENIYSFTTKGYEQIKMPQEPTKEGCIFDGWYLDENSWQNVFTEDSIKEDMLVANLFVFAKWIPNNYLVSFFIWDEEKEEYKEEDVIKVIVGQKINVPNSSLEGYSVKKWYIDEENLTQWDFDTPMPTDAVNLYGKWSINQYSIAFFTDGGGEITEIIQDYATSIEAPEEPKKEGYTFNGWYIDNNEFKNEFDFVTMPGNDIILYAKWTANKYTINFDSNGGEEITAITQDYGTAVVLPTDIIKIGYTFDGWYTDKVTYTNKYNYPTMPAEGFTLYAKWNINQYTISFNSNAGSVVSAITQDYGAEVIEPNEPTKEGYTFDGWYTVSISKYIFNTMPADDIILYAKWTPNNYPVSFFIWDEAQESYIQEGSVLETPYGKPINIPKFLREEYSINNWYTDEGKTTEWDIATPMPADNVSLYGFWTINQYTISFNSNNGSAVTQIIQDYGTEVIAPTEPTKEGYTFESWYTDNGTFENEYIFSTIPAEDIILHAKWIVNQYTINFNSNDGSAVATITQDYGTEVIAPVEPIRNYYTFNGWYTDNGTFENAYIFTTIPAESFTLYAKWTINQYTISFNSNNGSAVTQIIQDYGTEVIAPTEPTKEGYTFESWYTDNGTFENEYIFSTIPAEDIILHAKWIVNQYTINFNSNDGSVVATITQEYGTEVIEPIQPMKEGYTFEGWYTDNGTFEYKYIFSTIPAENFTLYANWTINKYAILFRTNGGNAITAIRQDYGTEVVAPTEPTKEGHTFDGWYTDNDTFENEYIFTTIPAENFILYAKWTINQYIISFNSNNGSEVTAIMQDYGTEVIEPTEPTKEGHTFESWYTDNVTFENEYIFSTIPAENFTLYAKWISNKYTISFNSNDGSEVAAIIQDYGTNVIEPAYPEKLHYNFGGWYTDNEVFQNIYEFNTMPSQNIILYAKWVEKEYIVIFIGNGGTLISGSETQSIKYGFAAIPPVYEKTNYNLSWDKSFDFISENITVSALWEWAENYTEGLSYSFIENGTAYEVSVGSAKNENEIIIPSSHNGIPVYSIANSGFRGCTAKYVTISDSIKSIDNLAFNSCGNLIAITLGNSLTSIGNSAFTGCGKLVEICNNSSLAIIKGEQYKNGSIGSYVLNIYTSSSGSSKIITTDSDYIFYYDDTICYLVGYLGTENEIVLPNNFNEKNYVLYDYAFYGCISLTSVTIPYGITSVGRGAFKNCHNLASITIPNSVIIIGERAFVSCHSLTSIIIPDSVTIIDEWAFQDSGLTSITIPDSVTSVGANAFLSTPWYRNQNGLIYAGKVAYEYKGVMEENTGITLLPGTKSIADYAFNNCSSLTSITIPYGVVTIGKMAFYGCSGLASLTIPASVTDIGFYAFCCCSGLTSIVIPNSVTRMGYAAFASCNKLVSITLPFIGTNDTQFGTNNTEFGSIFAGTYNVPLSLKTIIITGGANITDNAFTNCSGLTTIILPDSVISIGYSAFDGCTGLTTIILPDSVISIGDYAFNGCTGLTSITIPGSVTSIGSNAFSGCSELTSITISDNVTSIGESAFNGCNNLSKVQITDTLVWYAIAFANQTSNPIYYAKNLYVNGELATNLIVPNSVTNIGDFLFIGCTSLNAITIPDSVTTIGTSAFESCDSLTSIIIPDSVTGIGESAFSGCNSIASITLPFIGNTKDGTSNNNFGYIFGASSNVPSSLKTVIITGGTSIGDYAFNNCSSLTSITIPDSITSIGEWAFYGCSSLTSISIPDGLTSVGKWAFYGCSSITSIIIPDSVTSMGKYAFLGCNSIISITLPFIGNTIDGTSNNNFGYIFGAYNYSENDIYIPSSLKTVIITGGTSIGDYAFNSCSSLTSITIPDSITSIGYQAFDYCIQLIEININENNSTYLSQEGIIYNKFMTEIIAVPPGITSVILPESITNIGTREFLYGNSLASIIIPASVTSIGNWAFYTCEKLYEIIVDENNLYYSSQDGIIYNKNKTKIISAAQGIIGSVLLPESVKTIGNYAFNNCSKITSITLPVGLSIIEFCAFSGCSGLTSIAIPNSVTRIEDAVFYRCSNLASIVIPNSVYFIGKHVFDTTAWYENQPDGLVYIGKVAYKYKGEMPENTEIILLSDTVTIAGAAFEDCQGLYSIVIPESVICMGNECFARCTSLKEVYLGASVRLSFHNDFLGCSSLENISVSDDSTVHYEIDGVVFYLGEPIYLITNVGEYLYYTDTLWVYPFGKTDFEYVIPYGTTGIMQYAFSGTDNLQTVIIPDTVSIIGFAAFHDSGIREINIPDGIKFIADMTFYNCNSLETIKISESVKRINKDAFFNCTSLTTVYYEGTEEQWNDIVVASGNECLLNATIVYNCGMQYSNEGNSIYWQTKYPSDTNEYAFIYEIMDIAEETLNNTSNIELTGGAYVIGTIDYTLFDLSQDDAIDMYYTFLFSQYSYYFLSNTLAYNEQNIYIIIDEEYITYAARQATNSAIANTLAALDAEMELLDTELEKIYAIYNFIMDEVYYEYEEDGVTPSDSITAHNIVGVLDGSELTNSVCEGYAKAFAYLCNLYGIDCLAIISDTMNHGWNAVRIEGIWYWVDITWDDATSTNDYFLKGNYTFLSSHYSIDDWWVYPVVSNYDFYN